MGCVCGARGAVPERARDVAGAWAEGWQQQLAAKLAGLKLVIGAKVQMEAE